MQRYLIVVEKAKGNYSAYSPDVPGCVATGDTQQEAESNMHQALERHLQGLLEDGKVIPQPTAIAEYVTV